MALANFQSQNQSFSQPSGLFVHSVNIFLGMYQILFWMLALPIPVKRVQMHLNSGLNYYYQAVFNLQLDDSKILHHLDFNSIASPICMKTVLQLASQQRPANPFSTSYPNKQSYWYNMPKFEVYIVPVLCKEWMLEMKWLGWMSKLVTSNV